MAEEKVVCDWAMFGWSLGEEPVLVRDWATWRAAPVSQALIKRLHKIKALHRDEIIRYVTAFEAQGSNTEKLAFLSGKLTAIITLLETIDVKTE